MSDAEEFPVLDEIVENNQSWPVMAAKYGVENPLPPWKTSLDGLCDVLDRSCAGDEELGRRSLKLFRELDAYMAESLVLHIAKEEDVLFPALRGFGAELDQVIDEMVEQHDEVRLRQSIIEKVLAALNHTHDDVDAERAALAANLKDAGDQPTPELLETLWDGVKRLDWILQGHFGDEEDDLFVPALELLDEATWARLDAASRAIDL